MEVIHDGPHSRVERDGDFVRKYYKCFLEFGVNFRERYWLRRFGHNVALSTDGAHLRMPDFGVPLTRENLPEDYEEKAEKILSSMRGFAVRHNDIKPDNILLLEGQHLVLIDWTWATPAGVDPYPEWPEKLGSRWRKPNGWDDEYSLFKSLEEIRNG